LSSKDIDLPDDPQFAAPTANYFMGMYEAHWRTFFTRVRGRGVLRCSDAPFACWDFFTKVVKKMLK
jgi:hypothetical protein